MQRSSTTILFALACATISVAQVTIWQTGPAHGVAETGDVNGDGHDDFATHTSSGSTLVLVHSGRTGQVLHSLDLGPHPGNRGVLVTRAGDLDGDGFSDVVIGIPQDAYLSPESGFVYAYSGRTGTRLWTHVEPAVYRSYARSVACAGDVNADGYDDVIVGVRDDSSSGLAVVHSGRGGIVLRRLYPPLGGGDDFGAVTRGVGDIDHDGFDDVAVSAPALGTRLTPYHGGVYVFSVRTGAVLQTRLGSQSDEFFGRIMDAAGDWDGDLACDLVAGGASATVVFAAASGSALAILPTAVAVAGLGDVDGDSSPEVAITTESNDVAIRSRSSAVPIHVLPSAGRLITGLGDIDGDGFADFGVCESPIARVLDLGHSGSPAVARAFGHACSASTGTLPQIRLAGLPRIGQHVKFALRGATPVRPVILNLGLPASVDLSGFGMPGCTLLATTGWIGLPAYADAFGVAAQGPIPIPNSSALVGTTLAAQWVCVDATANPAGIALSNAIALTIGA